MSKSITQKICDVPNCNKITKTRLCAKHYYRLRLHGDVNHVREPKHNKACIIDGCSGIGRITKGKRYLTKGYCSKHYSRYIRFGSISDSDVTHIKNGQRSHKLYYTYYNMKLRCMKKQNKSYSNYGGRGIKVCDRWLGKYGFDNFLKDMGERPEGSSLDRIDNNGNYSPGNCRWATIHQQSGNKRNNNDVIGVSRAKNSWCAELSVNKKRFRKQFTNKSDAINYRKQLENTYL